MRLRVREKRFFCTHAFTLSLPVALPLTTCRTSLKTQRNMQGNCAAPPPDTLNPERVAVILTPEPWSAPRCVIIVSTDTFIAEAANVWVDSLHIQVVQEVTLVPRVFWFAWSAVLFLTNSVIQGDNSTDAAGLFLSGSTRGVHASSACPSLAHFNPRSRPRPMHACCLVPLIVQSTAMLGGTAQVIKVQFRDQTTQTPTALVARARDAGLLR